MTNDEISQIVEIDRLNMSPFFSYSGRDFNAELRKSGIIKEVANGAVFFVVKENEKIIGYIELIEREDKRVTVKSVQIHPSKQNGVTLRRLIEGIYPKLKNIFAEHQVISATHRINQKSISLHRKLGFIETDIDDDLTTFRCDGVELLARLEKYIKREDA